MPNILVSAKAIIRKRGSILLLRQARPGGLHYWDLPGGKLQYGETIEGALKREVKEETGLEVTAATFCGVWQFYSPTNKHQVICITFMCTTQKHAVDITHNVADDEYIGDYAWATKADIQAGLYYMLDPSLVEIIQKLPG